MREFVLMTDSDTEIPYTFAEEHDIPVFLMPYTLDGKESLFDLGKTTDFEGFYKALRDGKDALTSTRSTYDIQLFYEDILKEGKDILYLCFSSQLSSHYDLACMAREAALENYPDARIEIVDTLSISMGAGLLVYHAQKLKDQGKTLDEIKDWVENNKLNALHFFSVDDLKYLKKTGRVSAVSATLGTMLDIKPVLVLTKEGKIVANDKVKGKKKLIKYLTDKVVKNYVDDEIGKDLFVIMYGDNREQAEELRDSVLKEVSFNNVWLQHVGPVIGCHCGPSVMAALIMGHQRES
jgi:DegV family protein with EDD domain